MPFNPPVPNGLHAIIATFGDPTPFIQNDATLSTTWEVDTLVTFALPFPIPIAWNLGTTATRMRCHHLLVNTFRSVFTDIQTQGLQSKVQSYGGCYAGRAKRTSSHLSAHAWGIAVDLNTNTNAQGTRGDMDPGVIRVFQSHGFKWGGEFSGSSIDPMHFQYCTGY